MREQAKDRLKDVGIEVGRVIAKTLFERLRDWWRYDRPRAREKRRG